MKNISRHVGTLVILDRLPTSTNGNPRYLLSIGGTTCATMVDSMIAYSIGNHEGKEVRATIGTHYGRATLHTLERT